MKGMQEIARSGVLKSCKLCHRSLADLSTDSMHTGLLPKAWLLLCTTMTRP